MEQIIDHLKKNYSGHFLFAITEDDKVTLSWKLTKADVLVIIGRLTKEFGLDPDAVSYTCKQLNSQQRGNLM
jgi:hypothetical protein